MKALFVKSFSLCHNYLQVCGTHAKARAYRFLAEDAVNFCDDQELMKHPALPIELRPRKIDGAAGTRTRNWRLKGDVVPSAFVAKR